MCRNSGNSTGSQQVDLCPQVFAQLLISYGERLNSTRAFSRKRGRPRFLPPIPTIVPHSGYMTENPAFSDLPAAVGLLCCSLPALAGDRPVSDARTDSGQQDGCSGDVLGLRPVAGEGSAPTLAKRVLGVYARHAQPLRRRRMNWSTEGNKPCRA